MNSWQFVQSICCMAMVAHLAWGDDFRIESQVYSGRQAKPVSENLTLFTDKVVYDFLFDPEDASRITEIVIYDLDKERFVLLDTQRELKLEIQTVDVQQLLLSLKNSEPWREKYPFLMEPAFEVSYDAAANQLEMTSKYMTYSVKVETPAKSQAFPVYGRFIDAYAQLNATDPQKLPPFARLELNRELKDRRLIPSEVEMTMEVPNPGLGSTHVSATSKHSVIWQLSKTDHERIEMANRSWTKYRSATLGEYRRLSTQTASQR
jgi:hypothetical protein